MKLNGFLILPTWTRVVIVGVPGRAVIAIATIMSGGMIEAAESRGFITSDGARLHHLEAGPSGAAAARTD